MRRYIFRMTEQFFGNYKVIRKIGAGGMAQVYLAVHKDIPNLKVVLKILGDPRLAERFRQEADKLALLDGHQNVCAIKHFFNHGDDFVIAMEHIEGVTLDDMIKNSGQLPVADSLQIIRDVLDTLHFAHQKDIFHRDIKPGNIMIDSRGQVKIIDFGIAKSKTDPNLTIAGSSCGTPAYMSPEQFNPTEDIDYAKVDIYAVGTTLFYMLTGKLPFTGDNQFALRDAKMFNDPPRPRQLNADIPQPLEEIILKSMARDPEGRYPTALAMRDAIGTLAPGAKRVDLTDTIAPVLSPPAKKPKKKAVKPIPIVAALAVVILAAIVYFAVIREPGPATLPVPQPTTPSADAVINTDRPTYTWAAVPLENVAYLLEYAADSALAEPIERTMIAGTAYTPANPLPDGRYFWRVQLVDGDGNRSAPSAAISFTVAAGPPTPLQAVLTVSVSPRGDVYIDGQSYGRNKQSVAATLDSGEHTVRVINRGSDQQRFDETVYLAGGDSQSLAFEFTIPPEPPAVDSGKVIIGSRPDGAVVFIDGNLQDEVTNHTFDLPTGKYLIKLVLTIEGQQLEKIDSVVVVKDSTVKKMFVFDN